jgi:hypothetical protein
LNRPELESAYRTAVVDPGVRAALDAAPPGNRLIYIVPENWDLLPVEARSAATTLPRRSNDFDRTRYRLLFARVRSHDPGATGPEIVKGAYALDPIAVAQVDTATERVTVEPLPVHVRWGDIPIPIY